MPNYGSTQIVRNRAREDYFEPARRAGLTHVSIRSGDFNKSLVARRLIPANRLPLICNALASKKLLEENQAVLERVDGPPSGRSSTVVYTYRLETAQVPASVRESEASDSFAALGGILRDAYSQLGGAEEFHRKERAGWGD